MPRSTGIWLRGEPAPNEQRAPLVPADAVILIAEGIPVIVEESGQRAFPVDEYAAAGCRGVPGGSWPGAPPGEVILGFKEPSAPPSPLAPRPVFFCPPPKGPEGGPALL